MFKFFSSLFSHINKSIKNIVNKQLSKSYKQHLVSIIYDLLFAVVCVIGIILANNNGSDTGLTFFVRLFGLAMILFVFDVMAITEKWTQSYIEDINNRG